MTKQEEARERVLDLVEALVIGQPIPSERQLTQELGVSRLTIRAALDELVRDGYLDRRHGSGTYVTEPKIAQPLTQEFRGARVQTGQESVKIRARPGGRRRASSRQSPGYEKWY